MITALYQLFTSDPELVDALGFTPRNKKIRPFAPKDKTDYPYLIYNASPSRTEYPIQEYRCEVFILSKDLSVLERATERTIDLLNIGRDNSSFTFNGKTFLNSQHVSGEGINYDPDQDLYEQILNFNIKIKG